MNMNSMIADKHDGQPALLSHFSIAILACTLLGMGLGRFVPPQMSPCAILAGITGVFYYLTCLWRDRRQQAEHVSAVRQIVEHRLTAQLEHPSSSDRHRCRPTPARSPSALLKNANQLF